MLMKLNTARLWTIVLASVIVALMVSLTTVHSSTTPLTLTIDTMPQ